MIPKEFIQPIKQYLDKFAKKDAVFASKYDGSKEALEKCCQFIMDEARKMVKGGSAVAVPDKIVYGWAVHYFDEKPATNKAVCAKVVVQRSKQIEDFEKRQLSLFPEML